MKELHSHTQNGLITIEDDSSYSSSDFSDLEGDEEEIEVEIQIQEEIEVKSKIPQITVKKFEQGFYQRSMFYQKKKEKKLAKLKIEVRKKK